MKAFITGIFIVLSGCTTTVQKPYTICHEQNCGDKVNVEVVKNGTPIK